MGRGNEISLWYDNWTETQSIAERVGLNDDVHPDPSVTVSKFIHNTQWDIQKLNQTLNNHSIIQKTTGIALPVIDIKDTFC